MAQKQKVSGTVYNETKETLLGVYVIVKGTSNGVSTDLEGKYTIDVEDQPYRGMIVTSFI